MSYSEQQHLLRWYVLDTNARPAHNVLRPISTYYPEFLSQKFETFNKNRILWDYEECAPLILSLINAAKKLWGDVESKQFILGVTECEIQQGILRNPQRHASCLWLKRTIHQLNSASCNINKYADGLDSTNDLNARRAELLLELHEKLQLTLKPESIHNFDATWGCDGILMDSEHDDYLLRLCATFEQCVKDMFTKAANKREQHALNDRLLEELAQHTSLAQTKCTYFYGREAVMDMIQSYLTTVYTDRTPYMLITGESGIGKTSVVAKTMKMARRWLGKRVAVIARFIGTTPESSRARSVIQSLTLQINRIYRTVTHSSEHDVLSFNNNCKDFANSLMSASKKRPLVILLDSVDLLDPMDEAINLTWLPRRLPSNVKVILSSTLEPQFLQTFMTVVQSTKCKMERFSKEDAMNLLKDWLKRDNRWLTEDQFQAVESAFLGCGLPLYVQLTLQEVKVWRSFSDPKQLQPTIQEAIRNFFQKIERIHGRIFGSHMLGYLTLASRGLSEAELEDILSCDDDVLNEVLAFWIPPIRRLPPMLLARIKSDLGIYIGQRDIDNTHVLQWNHQLFKDVAYEMYCNNPQTAVYLHQQLADFFSGTWSGTPKPYCNKHGEEGREERRVARQPLKHGNCPNLRKLNNLPWHLAHLTTSEALKTQCLFNLDFITTKMAAVGIRPVIDDLAVAMEMFPYEAYLFETLRDTIQISQYALLRDVTELPTQLLNRLSWQKNSKELKRLLNDCLNVCSDILICDHQILTPPGGKLQHSLATHKGKVLSLDLSKNGCTAVTCGTDKKLMIWDVCYGKLLLEVSLEENDRPIRALLASDDRSVVLICEESVTTFVTNTGRQMEKVTFDDLDLENPAVCIAGRVTAGEEKVDKAMVVMVTDNKVVMLGSKKLGSKRRITFRFCELTEGKIGAKSLCIGHNEYVAVTDTDRHRVRVFGIKSRTSIATRRIYPRFDLLSSTDDAGPTVDAMCFSKDGYFLFVSNWRNGYILCLDAYDLGEVRRVQASEEYSISNFQITNDGLLFFPSGQSVVVYDIHTSKRSCFDQKGQVSFAATNDFNSLITVGDDSILRLWKCDQRKLAWLNQSGKAVEAPENIIRSLCLFRSTPRYALALKVYTDLSREILVQDLLEKKVVRSASYTGNLEVDMFEEDDKNVTAIVRCPSGQLGILDLNKMTCNVIPNITTAEQRSPEERTFTILRIRREVVALSSLRTGLNILDLRTKQLQHIIVGRNEVEINNFQISPTESRLAVATKDGICHVYDIERRTCLVRLTPESICGSEADSCVTFLKVISFTEDDRFVILETADFIKVWNLSKGRPSKDLDVYLETDKFVNITSCRPLPGHKLLTVDEEAMMRVFNVRTGKTVSSYRINDSDVHLSTGPSDIYATYGMDPADQVVSVWTSQRMQPVASFTSEQPLDLVTISRNGKSVIGCLRNPASIISWNIQDGTISREKIFAGPELFSGQKRGMVLKINNDTNSSVDFLTDDDLDSD